MKKKKEKNITLLRVEDLVQLFGVHRNTIERWVKLNENFPKPKKMSIGRTNFWIKSEIMDYISQR